jgi:hypothetical protein
VKATIDEKRVELGKRLVMLRHEITRVLERLRQLDAAHATEEGESP